MKMKIKHTLFALIISIALSTALFAGIKEGMWLYSEEEYGAASVELLKSISESKVVDIEAYIALTHSYIMLNEYDKAMIIVRKAIMITQSRYRLHYFKAIIHYQMREYEKSLAELKHAVFLNPQSAYSFNYMGLVYLRLGKANSAEESFKSALRYFPENAIFFHNLGKAYERQGKLVKAYKAYRHSKNTDQNYAQAAESVERLNKYLTERGIDIPAEDDTFIDEDITEIVGQIENKTENN